MRERKKRWRRDRSETDATDKPNMTPMIDVTFLLLIFFLCLEFKTLEAKLASNLPKEHGASTAPAIPREDLELRISVRDRGRREADPARPDRIRWVGHSCRYQLGPERFNRLADLTAALRRVARERRLPVKVLTGAEVVYQDVTQVLDAVLDSGFEEVVFAAKGPTHRSR